MFRGSRDHVSARTFEHACRERDTIIRELAEVIERQNDRIMYLAGRAWPASLPQATVTEPFDELDVLHDYEQTIAE